MKKQTLFSYSNRVKLMIKQLLNSISIKIILLFSIMTFLISSIATYSASYSMHLLHAQVIETGEYNIELAVNQIDSELVNINNYLYSVMTDNADIDVLSDTAMKDSNKYHLSRTILWNSMGKQILSFNYAEALFLFVPENNELLLRIRSLTYARSQELKQFILNIQETQRENNWTVIQIGEEKYLVRTVSYNQSMLGAFIRVSDLLRKLKIIENYESRIVQIHSLNGSIEDKNHIIMECASKKGEYKIIGGISKDEIYRKLPIIQKAAFVIAIGSFFCIPGWIILLNFWLIKPLSIIKKAMERFKEGVIDYKIPQFRTSYEFSQINETFNKMTAAIKDLTIENYEKKLEKQRADFQILQLKINPHFLLNSFNIMYSLAQIKDFKAVQMLCFNLSNYFRYIFQKDCEYVALKRELDFVRDYLNISSMRFPDCFIADFDVDESLMDYPVLPLLVENFVENCIKHAIIPGDCINIRIIAKDRGEYVEIKVIDNGRGMEQTKADLILAGEFVDEKGIHTGILNCKKRLKSFYGEDAKLLLKSILNQGTEVIIQILKKGAAKDESADCR